MLHKADATTIYKNPPIISVGNIMFLRAAGMRHGAAVSTGWYGNDREAGEPNRKGSESADRRRQLYPSGLAGAEWALAVRMFRPAKRGGRPHIPQRTAPLARASSATSQGDITLHSSTNMSYFDV